MVGPYFVSSFFQVKFIAIHDKIVYIYNPLMAQMKFSTHPLFPVSGMRGEETGGVIKWGQKEIAIRASELWLVT